MAERVLAVTGANGFIGRRLVQVAARRGWQVAPWTRTGGIDVRDGAAIAAAARCDRPAAVVHCAASGVAPDRAHDPAVVGDNAALAAGLLGGLAQAGIPAPMVVVAGSMAEYGRSGVLHEDDRCEPATAYAIGKLAATHLALAFGRRHAIPVVAARLFGVWGPGEAAHRLLPSLLHRLRRGEAVELSDGGQVRDFVFVDDVAAALLDLATCPAAAGRIVNVGTGQGVNVGDLCRAVADAVGADHALLRFGARARSAGDADRLVADVGLLGRLLGWRPQHSIMPFVVESVNEAGMDLPANCSASH